MKILVGGDTHGDTHHTKYLIDRAVDRQIDTVFVVGDFGYWEHEESGVCYLDELDEYAAKEGVVVYFLDGNHDKTSLLLKNYGNDRDDEGFILVREAVRYAARGHRWVWDGRKFIALGGAYSVDKAWRLEREAEMSRRTLAMLSAEDLRDLPMVMRDSYAETLWFPEEEMSDNDMDVILLRDSSSVDVMLTHDKPRASNPGQNRKAYLECLPNQDRIQRAVVALKPSLLVHGHLHYRYDDAIRNGNEDGESNWTRIVGLDCNTPASTSGRAKNSWIVYDCVKGDVES